MLRILGFTFLLAGALWAGKPKTTGPFKAESQSVTLSATLILDREEIKQLLGSDLDGHYILVSVTITPKFGQEVDVRRDDFLLRTDKDGERSTPYTASQIAGRGALIVTQTESRSSPGVTIGGPMARMGAGAGSGDTNASSKMNTGAGEKESPLLKALNEKILPEKKTEAPVSGLLYFPMEKQKQKDLELIYTAPDGKVNLRFR